MSFAFVAVSDAWIHGTGVQTALNSLSEYIRGVEGPQFADQRGFTCQAIEERLA